MPPTTSGDRALLVETEEADEPRRVLGLVRQDRQAAVDLHRVRGDELRRDPARDLLRNGALARRGRPEDREDELSHAEAPLAVPSSGRSGLARASV